MKALAGLLVACAVFPGAASAQVASDSKHASSPWALDVSLGKTRYQSTERSSSGAISNQETGELPQAKLALTWQGGGQRDGQGGTWFGQGYYALARHDVAYQGYTQIGIPLATTTELAIHQAGAHAGYRWQWGDSTQGTALAGLERMQVRRNILPGVWSLPLNEIITSTRAVLGTQVRHRLGILPVVAWPVTLSGGAEALQALHTTIDVNTQGLYDPITLSPAKKLDWRWQLRAEVNPSRAVALWAGVAQERFTPGDTPVAVWLRNGTPAAGVRYPGSEQRLQTLSLGLQVSF
jgi:hypothetical protein